MNIGRQLSKIGNRNEGACSARADFGAPCCRTVPQPLLLHSASAFTVKLCSYVCGTAAVMDSAPVLRNFTGRWTYDLKSDSFKPYLESMGA